VNELSLAASSCDARCTEDAAPLTTCPIPACQSYISRATP
jgi:hypothetical protein